MLLDATKPQDGSNGTTNDGLYSDNNENNRITGSEVYKMNLEKNLQSSNHFENDFIGLPSGCFYKFRAII